MKYTAALFAALLLAPQAALQAADLELTETLQLSECHSLGWARSNSQPAKQKKGAWAVDPVLWQQAVQQKGEGEKEDTTFSLWVPDGIKYAKGIVVISGHGSGEALYKHPEMRKLALELHLAIFKFIGNPMQRGFWPTTLLYDRLKAFGEKSNHSELEHAPLFLYGHSNGTGFSAVFPATESERVWAWVSMRPGTTQMVDQPRAALVPGMVMFGEDDPYFVKPSQKENMAIVETMRKDHAALWNYAVEPNTGHGPGEKSWPLVFSFLRHTWAARVPADADPRQGPVKLTALALERGHLGKNWDPSKGGYQELPVAPFTEFTDDRSTSSWLINSAFAADWQAFQRDGQVPASLPGKISDYRGYQRHDFVVDGCPTIVVVPKKVAPGKPWIWRAEFFDAFPQVDLALLDRGFHLVHIRVGNTFGCPDALAHWDVLYKELTEKYGLSRKPVLEGLSRGGLYCFNWAADNPDKVGCILADNAVLDFKSWPGGKGKGKGSPGDWKKLLQDYHFASEAEALAYTKNPVDNLEPLAKAKVHVFLLCGDADDVVPYPENGAIVKERYEKLAGPVRLLIKKGMGHHPHGLDDPTPVVEYILEHTTARAPDRAAEPRLAYNDVHPQRYDLTARASMIDPRAREHPEIDFVFEKQGKPSDVEHAVVDTRVAPQGKLVIWLMGYSPPLFERLSGYGFHAIQVHYANGWFGKLSKEVPTSDDKFLGKIRLEAATGEDFSDAVSIPKPDGIMERAFQLVKWLAKENPQGRWGLFLSDDGQGLRWDRVIIAGSSHGSTTAARFAIHQRVDRVVMFCGPRDQLETWQALPSATPSNRFFGFSHTLDGGWSGDHYCRSWELLGLHHYGPIVNVDQAQLPFGNTRRLITTADVKKDAGRAHSCVVPGGAAVKDASGQFVHEAVWRYLFTHPVDVTGESVSADPDCLKDQRPAPQKPK